MAEPPGGLVRTIDIPLGARRARLDVKEA